MIYKNRIFTVLIIVFYGFVTLFISCNRESENNSTVTLELQRQAGEKLAHKYCGTCHLPVAPGLLDKETWVNSVLPAMAPKLGIGVWQQNSYYPAGGIRDETAVSFAEWMNIVRYFESEAPESLIAAEPPVPLLGGWSLFSIVKPEAPVSPAPSATTTMVKIDPRTGNIYSSDANTNALFRWDRNLKPEKVMSFSQPSPAVELLFLNDSENTREAVLTTIGTMKAEDVFRGAVQTLRLEGDTAHVAEVIASRLTRPLRAHRADVNKDGLDDWIICEFGHNTGGLHLYQQESDGSYSRKTIRGVPGAEQVMIDDFNGDGWPDLMVLFAYDDEGIWLFMNNREGGFESRNILRFPPVFGSTSFELADFNSDGLKDIVLTNGDNADYSPILKPYHGLRIYINNGGHTYTEAYFYPLNGATKAITEDFDNDGDLDIVTISFFADPEHNPSESLVYFEQKGELTFEPHSIPVSGHGRWIVMDAGDVDQDGDVDIVLGNFSGKFMEGENLDSSWDTRTPLILLLNNTR